MKYNQILKKYESIFWQLKGARSQIIYYHLLYDYEIIKRQISQSGGGYNEKQNQAISL